jgi:hypothetical protein
MSKFISVSWWIRFVKFNVIGTVPFLIATPLFFYLYPIYGVWSWFIVNIIGAMTHFLLVEYCNQHKIGFMFHEPKDLKSEKVKL